MFGCYTFVRYLLAHKLHLRTHVVPILNLVAIMCRYNIPARVKKKKTGIRS